LNRDKENTTELLSCIIIPESGDRKGSGKNGEAERGVDESFFLEEHGADGRKL